MRTPAPALGELLARAMDCFRFGRLPEAEALFRRVLQAQPAQFDALLMLGVVKAQRGERAEAVRLLRKAIEKNPGVAFAHLSLGDVLHDLGQPAAALASYERALAIEPGNADVLNNRATALRDLGRREEALAGYDHALAIAPGFAEAFANRGNLLAEIGRDAEALESYDRAVAIAPGHGLAWFGRGNALARLGRHEEAVAAYARVVGLAPDFADAWYNRGNSLRALRRHAEAIDSYARAIACRPDHVDAINNHGLALAEFDRAAEALGSYDRAIALRPGFAEAHFNRGVALRLLRRFDDALASFDRALALDAGHAEAAAMRVDTAQHLCRWERFAEDRAELERQIVAGRPVPPFVALHSFDAPELHLRAARAWIAKQAVAEAPRPGPYRHDRIRVAYVSADYRVHPVAYHVAPLIELHDRARFEVIGISLGGPDDSAVRRRLEAAFDGFFSVAARTDGEIAALMREQEIDIAVDLMGHTLDARPMIFAHRAAPVQVGWLGYPGTSGAGFFDFVLVDNTIFRPGDAAFYSERAVCLPDTYQMNEADMGGAGCTRAELGLPEQGLVLCCFNQPYKITPEVFSIWMRVLRNTEASVLWLYAADPAARRNLREAAARDGVAAELLVFADPVDRDRHLGRIGQADLFLDTFPYGAHITASDALRAGVPIVTCAGRSFPARVCESLLRSVGVAELVTGSLADYECLAMRLAGDRGALGAFKGTIVANLAGSGLFDGRRFCTNIEAAYIRMCASVRD